MGLLDFLKGAAGAAVGNITVESAILPPFTIAAPLGSGDSSPGSGPGFLVSLIRPKVTVQTAAGTVSAAPGGEPPAFPWLGVGIGIAALGIVALAGYGALKLVRR